MESPQHALIFYLFAERDERISLLVTTFLAIVVFVLVVLEMVPEESDSVPLFCEYQKPRNVITFLSRDNSSSCFQTT